MGSCKNVSGSGGSGGSGRGLGGCLEGVWRVLEGLGGCLEGPGGSGVVVWLAGLAGWLAGRVAGWLAGWRAGWPDGWLGGLAGCTGAAGRRVGRRRTGRMRLVRYGRGRFTPGSPRSPVGSVVDRLSSASTYAAASLVLSSSSRRYLPLSPKDDVNAIQPQHPAARGSKRQRQRQ